MKNVRTIVTVLAIVLFGGLLTMCSSQVIQPGSVGVKIRTLGTNAGVDPRPYNSGWHFNWLGERFVEFPIIQRTYTYTREPDERGPENEEIHFSDNNALPMTADVQLIMKVEAAKAPGLYTNFRLSFDQMFEGPIRNDTRTAIAAETELVSVEYLYKGGRQEVIHKALVRLQKKWGPLGVEITQLDWIGPIRYPEVILESIQQKTKAEADTQAALARVEVAKANAQSVIEQARGQAEANRLLAASVSPAIVDLKAIEKWDGRLPQVTGGATPYVNVPTR